MWKAGAGCRFKKATNWLILFSASYNPAEKYCWRQESAMLNTDQPTWPETFIRFLK
jgi:hypothetical protein